MARQWHVARENMKALQGEGKKGGSVAVNADSIKKVKVEDGTNSLRKKTGWTFFPSASLEASLGSSGGGAGRSWSFLPGEASDLGKGELGKNELGKGLGNGSSMELSSSILRPEPGQLLGEVRERFIEGLVSQVNLLCNECFVNRKLLFVFTGRTCLISYDRFARRPLAECTR